MESIDLLSLVTVPEVLLNLLMFKPGTKDKEFADTAGHALFIEISQNSTVMSRQNR